MIVGGSTCSCGCSSTVRAVSLVIVREDFGSVGQTWIVDRVVECNDFRVVRGWIVILVVEARMVSIDSGIDDGYGCT